MTSDPHMVMLSRNRLSTILITVWLMSCITSAGVSWYFAGVSSDRSNTALSNVVALQRQQGHDGLNVIYQSDKARCLTAVKARNVQIHNAIVQRDHEGSAVTIPNPLKPCAQSVHDPNHPTATAAHLVG